MAKILYRTEHGDLGSLWYNKKGVQTNQLFKILNESSFLRSLYMGKDGRVLLEGTYLSSAKSLEQLREWFNLEDFTRLVQEGYRLYKIEAGIYEDWGNEVIFQEESIKSKVLLDPSMMYENL